jgi:hypothetical protein
MTQKKQTHLEGVTPNGITSNENYLADNLIALERKAVGSLETALVEIKNLYLARRRAKLSASRARGVAGEVRELIKLLSEYGF